MKKVIKFGNILAVGVLVLGLCACGAREPKVTEKPKETEEAKQEVEPTEVPEFVYEVETKNMEEGENTIQYPSIINSNNPEVANKANEAIDAFLEEVIDSLKGEQGESVSMDIGYNYNQFCSSILSIEYNMLRVAQGATYPNHIYFTQNLLLEDATTLKLTDLFTIDPEFVKEFKAGIYVPYTDDLNLDDPEGAALGIIEQQYSDEELLAIFQDNDNATPFFLTSQGLIVSVEVPHAVGDHVEMAMNYDYLADNMKDIDIWENHDFMKAEDSKDASENEDAGDTSETEE